MKRAPFVPTTGRILKRDKFAAVGLAIPIALTLLCLLSIFQHALDARPEIQKILLRRDLTFAALAGISLPLVLLTVYRVRRIKDIFETGIVVSGTVVATHPVMVKTPVKVTYQFQGQAFVAEALLASREWQLHFRECPEVQVVLLPDSPKRAFVVNAYSKDPRAPEAG